MKTEEYYHVKMVNPVLANMLKNRYAPLEATKFFDPRSSTFGQLCTENL